MSTRTIGTRIVTLTGRAPVTIRESEWPIIARADGDSFMGCDHARHTQAVCQNEIDDYTLIARQHADGRTLVYGVVDAAIAAWGAPACGVSWRGGALLDSGSDVAAGIESVGRDAGMPEYLIRECVASLPPVVL